MRTRTADLASRRRALGQRRTEARQAGDWQTVAIVSEALEQVTREEEDREQAAALLAEQQAAQERDRAVGRRASAERAFARGTCDVDKVQATRAAVTVAERRLKEAQWARGICAQRIASRRSAVQDGKRGDAWDGAVGFGSKATPELRRALGGQ